jgi:AraC-like DNA-binding protein
VKSSPKLLVSTDAWLTALACPENRVEIDFHGVPPFYTAQRGWINQPQPFGQHLLYYVVSGSFRVRKGEREDAVEPGSLLWIPPWTAFHCWLPGDKPVSFYRFRLEVENRRGETLYRRDAPLLVHGIEPARRWFEDVVRAMDHRGGSLRRWRLRAALIGLFAEAQSSTAASAPSGLLRSLQREALEELVHRDGKVQVTPARLAAHLGLSADYFARLFRKTYGVSPRAWIVRERIKMAAVRLLESHLNVSEVAEEFGYGDIFFFSRQFKQIMGQSPKHYRGTARH